MEINMEQLHKAMTTEFFIYSIDFSKKGNVAEMILVESVKDGKFISQNEIGAMAFLEALENKEYLWISDLCKKVWEKDDVSWRPRKKVFEKGEIDEFDEQMRSVYSSLSKGVTQINVFF
jgi:hypothetical protein